MADSSHRRWRVTAAVTVVIGAMMLAGCGRPVYRAVPGPAAAAAKDAALSANSGCAQAAPVAERALGVLSHLRRGTLASSQARRLLGADQASLGKAARIDTSDTVLQEDLVLASEAIAAFRTVMLDPNEPAYRDTLANLAGTLAGFQRTCSVVSLLFTTGGNSATAMLTGSPPRVPTFKGAELVGLWARATMGAPTLTLRIRELSAGTVVGHQQVTMALGKSFRFGYLTYQVRRPGASVLSVTVSVAHLPPGHAFEVKDITISRD